MERTQTFSIPFSAFIFQFQHFNSGVDLLAFQVGCKGPVIAQEKKYLRTVLHVSKYMIVKADHRIYVFYS